MSGTRSLRSDARENRDHLLEIARKVLAADPQSSLNSIAKAAGVGPGTLYRHFPNREALVLGVYRKEIDKLVALAPSLLAKHEAFAALRLWCDQLVKFGKMKNAVSNVLDAVKSELDLGDTYGPLLEAVRQLLTACEDAGAIRPGFKAEDFLLLMGFLLRVQSGPDGEERAKRFLALFLRGLCP